MERLPPPEPDRDRSERLLAAARRVWTGAVPDRDHPQRVIANREAMDALGAVLAEF